MIITDSLVALDYIDQYYGGPYIAGSVPAAEHWVMSADIATVREIEAFARLSQLYPTGVVSIVSDTFDLRPVLTEYLPALKEQMLARNSKLVIRSDSGDPKKILCGDVQASGAARSGVVKLLDDEFGQTVTDKDFFELDPHIGVLYGDAITTDRAKAITHNPYKQNYASTNITFSVGSFTYQYNARDTFGSTMKATWAEVDGRGVNLFKDPAPDDGTNRSATSRLVVYHDAFDQSMELVQ